MKPSTLLERVYFYCNLHWNKGKKSIVNHFLDEGVAKATIYRMIKKWENGLPPIRAKGSGRKAKIMTKGNIKNLITAINDHASISTRRLAKRFNCDHSYVVKTIKKKTDIRYHNRMTVPYRTEKQKASCRPRCGRILKKFPEHEFILDDESYFTFANTEKNSNVGFWSADVSATSHSVKFKAKKKFEPKLLVWLAVSQRGISAPFIAPSGTAINQHIYLKECIIKRLLPFIEKYHSEGNYVFWPDLASSHYAKIVLNYLKENEVKFVAKEDNPPAVPELRPIENFWSILKGLVYDKGWEAKTLNQLKDRVKYCLRKVDMSMVQSMFLGVRRNLDAVRRHGFE